MKKEIKLYVVEGQDISKLIHLYVEGVPSDAPIPPSQSGTGWAEVSHQEDNVRIFSGTAERRYGTSDIEEEVRLFKPDVVIIPFDLHSEFNQGRISRWCERLDFVENPPKRMLVGVVTNPKALPNEEAFKAFTYMQNNPTEYGASSVTMCKLGDINSIRALFNKAQELTLKTETQVQKQTATQQQKAETPAQNSASAEKNTGLKGSRGGLFRKDAATNESPSTLRASLANITTQQSEAKAQVVHEDKRPSFINRASSLLSKSAAEKERNTIDTIAITLKSQSGEKINAQQIIRSTVFSGEAERRSEVKPTNAHEAVIRVVANQENSKIQFSAEYPRKDEAVVASQMAKVVAKASDAMPNGASAKIIQDNHSESMADAMNAAEKKNDLAVTTPSITFIKK